jgi:hypothetical protein
MNEPFAVVFQRRATHEIEQVDRWWRKNRSSSPDLFVTELERMLTAVALMPTLGTPARRAPRASRSDAVPRLLPGPRQPIEVLAVWHAERGKGPGL